MNILICKNRFAGLIEPLKGPLQLVEGFNISHRMGLSVELRIAGEGSQRGQIVSRLRTLGLERLARLTGPTAGWRREAASCVA